MNFIRIKQRKLFKPQFWNLEIYWGDGNYDYTNTMVWEWDVRTSGHTLISQIYNLEEFILLFIILDPLERFRFEKNRDCLNPG